MFFFFFSSRRRHTRCLSDWSSDVCSSDLILVRGLHVRAVLVGENFHFGHKQAGNVALLRELGARHGFAVEIIPPVALDGEIVSSTAIRREIASGSLTHAARLLGRPFVLTGEIVPGTGTGRRFTFPTLNLKPDQELLPDRKSVV